MKRSTICFIILVFHCRPSSAVDATAARIDDLIVAAWARDNVTPAPLADDAEFLRRVSIDIAGKIPSVFDVRRFLADKSPDKRRKVVERLLEGPGYIVNFSNKWRGVLMPEADSDFQVRFLLPSFEAWLRRKLREDASWADMAREILTLPLDNRNTRGRNAYVTATSRATPLAFYQAKQVAPENLAAATSRMFLGVRIECAQCHDHPWDSWKRDHFWGFAAFYAGIERTSGQGVFGRVRELNDRREIAVPDTQRVVQAAYLDGGQPQWRFREGPRETLARWVTSPRNKYFARTIANRIWRHFFGVGLVDPVDDFSSGNPPSHPELLDFLANEFIAHDFDVKFLIRAITASRAYQLTSRKTHDSQDKERLFARMAVRGMTPEQLLASLTQATGGFQPFSAQSGFVLRNDSRGEFRELFSNDSDSPTRTQTTILQALAMMNGQIVTGATDLKRSQMLGAVLEFPLLDTAGRVETLYLAALGRMPRPEELKRLTAYVNVGGPRKDEAQALADVFWALLNSSEFMFNH